MEINYLAVLACTLLAMVVGSLWYSPLLFGRTWMRLNKMNSADMGGKSQMQKEMAVIYSLQIAFAFLQAYVLAHFVEGWNDVSGVEVAIWIWLGFIIPVLAGSVMWTMEKWQDKVARFSIQAGYNLVLFIAFGYILGVWS
jgi:hypothetical protein